MGKDKIMIGDLETEFRRIFKEFIEFNSITPTTFAKEVNVHPAQILGYLKNKSGLTLSTLTKICKSEYFIKNRKPGKWENGIKGL